MNSTCSVPKPIDTSFPIIRPNLQSIPTDIVNIVIDYASDLECLTANCYRDLSNKDMYKARTVVALKLEYTFLIDAITSLFSRIEVTFYNEEGHWKVQHKFMDAKIEQIRELLDSIADARKKNPFHGLAQLKRMKLSTFIVLSDYAVAIFNTLKKDPLPHNILDVLNTVKLFADIGAAIKSPDLFKTVITPAVETDIANRIDVLFRDIPETGFESALWGLSSIPHMTSLYPSSLGGPRPWGIEVVLARRVYVKWSKVEKVKERVLLKMDSKHSSERKEAQALRNELLKISPVRCEDLKPLYEEVLCLAKLFPESKEYIDELHVVGPKDFN